MLSFLVICFSLLPAIVLISIFHYLYSIRYLHVPYCQANSFREYRIGEIEYGVRLGGIHSYIECKQLCISRS